MAGGFACFAGPQPSRFFSAIPSLVNLNSTSKIRVIIASQYGFAIERRNLNAYQRILYGSRFASIILLLRRGQSVTQELCERVVVHHAPVQNRFLFLVYVVLYAIGMRFCGTRHILTEPSGFAAAGFFAKYLAGYFWVLDVWDPPRRRTGYQETKQHPPLTDRLVFWLMGFADLYLLSVLPHAAKSIQMAEHKRLQLYNAIDLSCVAHKPPVRESTAALLHVAYTRSKFDWTMGLDTLLEAAEILHRRHCPVQIHLVGHVGEEDQQRITASPASHLFSLHGFITASLTDFHSRMHVGIVPFKAFENLSHVFPIKVLEHFSQGNPVVVSRLPGLCAMVQHEYNGLVVEPGDAPALADAIARLQQDESLFNRLAQRALESVRKFDVEMKHRRIFQAILGGRAERL